MTNIARVRNAINAWEHHTAGLVRFVEVLWNNVEPSQCFNFWRHVNDGVDIGAYDFDSIMHYTYKEFSKNGKPTLESKIPNEEIQHSRSIIPSDGDIAAMECLYDDSIDCDYR